MRDSKNAEFNSAIWYTVLNSYTVLEVQCNYLERVICQLTGPIRFCLRIRAASFDFRGIANGAWGYVRRNEIEQRLIFQSCVRKFFLMSVLQRAWVAYILLWGVLLAFIWKRWKACMAAHYVPPATRTACPLRKWAGAGSLAHRMVSMLSIITLGMKNVPLPIFTYAYAIYSRSIIGYSNQS